MPGLSFSFVVHIVKTLGQESRFFTRILTFDFIKFKLSQPKSLASWLGSENQYMGCVSDVLPASFVAPEPSARFWVSQFTPVKEHFPGGTIGPEQGFQTPRFACKQLCKAKRNSCSPQLIHCLSELQFIFSLYWHHSLLGLPITINRHQ